MPKILAAGKKEKKIKLSSSRRRELAIRDNELSEYGVSLGDIEQPRTPGRFFLCLVRGLLIFFACFGLIGGLVSSFGLPFSLPVVALGIFLLSIVTSFIYYNRLTFYLGYFLVFAGFLYLSIGYYWYINSGYQAFMNEVFNAYSDYFRLLSTREATEFVENRYLSVSVAMIFMGWFFCILLNITISGYMDLFTTFLITFLPLQLAFYIDIVPPLPYLCMLIAVYISVALLKRSGRFTLPYRQDSNLEFSRRRKRRRQLHMYYSSSKGMLQVFSYSVGISAVFLLLSTALFASDFDGRYVSNSVKDTTDRYVKSVVQGGFYSLFNRYQATGGLARGQLGGIGNVSPDFGTDLIVRLVPNNSSNIYLKAYTGVHYEHNTFSDSAVAENIEAAMDAAALAESEVYLPQLPAQHDVELSELYKNSSYVSKMWVANVDADDTYVYRPYFTINESARYYPGTGYSRVDIDNALLSGISAPRRQKGEAAFPGSAGLLDDKATIVSYSSGGDQECYELLYLPYDSVLAYNPNPDVDAAYQELVYNEYLQVPEELEDTLEDFCREAGLYEAAEAYPHSNKAYTSINSDAALSDYKTEQSRRLGIAGTLKRYFATEFQYTMSPGATPYNRDVVEYFLGTQKRGYCAHFASSSALLLRHMGIPTRYVEGYLCTLSEIMDGRPLSNSAEGWQSNAAELENAGIVEVEISDGSAHAWIEIWLDGYGWIPYEMTPPSDEEPAVNLDLMSLFGGLFNNTLRSSARNSNNSTSQITNNFNTNSFRMRFGNYGFILRPLSILLSALILFLLSFPLSRRLKENFRLSKLIKRGSYSEALLIHYRRLLARLKNNGWIGDSHPTLRDVQALLKSTAYSGKLPAASEYDRLFALLRTAAFSPVSIDRTDYLSAKHSLAAISRGIKKRTKADSLDPVREKGLEPSRKYMH